MLTQEKRLRHEAPGGRGSGGASLKKELEFDFFAPDPLPHIFLFLGGCLGKSRGCGVLEV